jgi:hypothetical protein
MSGIITASFANGHWEWTLSIDDGPQKTVIGDGPINAACDPDDIASRFGTWEAVEQDGEYIHVADRAGVLAGLADRLSGLNYHRDAQAVQQIMAAADWADAWPEIDREGDYTGRVIGNENGYYSVNNEAMISREEARAGGWSHDRDGQAWRNE